MQIDATIWVLTESRDSVSPGAGFRLVAKSQANVRGENDERWVSIWTSLPDSRSRPTRDEEFAACAEIVVGRSVLAVYGTVLPWRGSKWREHDSANASAYRAALAAQVADWRDLRGEAGANGLCVTGDFNQDLSDKPYYWSQGTRQLLEHSLAQLELVAVTRHPIDPVRELMGGERACIDHICLSRNVADRQIGRAHAWAPTHGERELSDHPGVWIELADL